MDTLCAMPAAEAQRRVRVEHAGEPVWGRLRGGADRARLGRADRERPPLPGAGRPVEDHRGPPDLPEPGRGVRRPHARGAVVLHEAADDAQRPPRRAAAPARRALPQLRGRAGRRDRPPHEGRRDGRALDHVAGLRPANDVGLHDFRHADRGAMLRVKGQDGFLPIGPELVPASEFDPTAFTLRTYLNGAVVQEARPTTSCGEWPTSSPTCAG